MTMQQTRTCDKCAGTITAEDLIRKRAGLVEGRLLCTSCVDELRRQVAAARAADRARAAAVAAETAAATASAVAEREERAAEAAAEMREAELRASLEREAATSETGGNGAIGADEDMSFAATETSSVYEEIREEQGMDAATVAADERQALMGDSVEAEVEEQIESHESLEAETPSAFAEARQPDKADEPVADREARGAELPRCLILHASPTEQGVLELQERLNEWLVGHPELSVKSTSTTVGPFAGIPGEQRFIVTVFFEVDPHIRRR